MKKALIILFLLVGLSVSKSYAADKGVITPEELPKLTDERAKEALCYIVNNQPLQCEAISGIFTAFKGKGRSTLEAYGDCLELLAGIQEIRAKKDQSELGI